MKLVVSDLSNIEGRLGAWLAGEDWKIKAFEDFDAGIGPDLYKIAYSKSFAVPVGDVTKTQRQVGKTSELAGQYQGSVGAYVSMAANLGIDINDIIEVSRRATSPAVWADTRERYTKRWSAGLDADRGTGIKVVVDAWRNAHPRIRAMWYDLERAAIEVVQNPDEARTVRSLRLDMKDGFMRIRKPSGVFLSYKGMSASTDCQMCEATGKVVVRGAFAVCEDCTGSGVSRPRLSFWGHKKKWCKINTYGGSLFENICQSTARDIFFNGLRLAEKEGYPVVLRAHDELACEVPDEDAYSAGKLSSMMAAKPSWAVGLPLAAAGAEMYRYAKAD